MHWEMPLIWISDLFLLWQHQLNGLPCSLPYINIWNQNYVIHIIQVSSQIQPFTYILFHHIRRIFIHNVDY